MAPTFLRGISLLCRSYKMTSSYRLAVVGKHMAVQSSSSNCQLSYTSASGQCFDELLVRLLGSGSSKESAAYQFINLYTASDDSSKRLLMKTLANEYSADNATVMNEIDHLQSAISSTDNPTTFSRLLQKVKGGLVCPYEKIFRAISAYPGGVKFLVDLRKDALKFSHNSSDSTEVADLQSINLNLKELLSLWFGVGFLQLERISWQSPCDMLDKVAQYEAVHPVRNVSDMRVRVGPYRRCYVFTHPTMPREPLVILHIALTRDIASSIQSIVKHPTLSSSEDFTQLEHGKEDTSAFDSAIFYSITSTQPGLHGIDLGHYLIKRVVEQLSHEFPHLSKFSSLSPIPGFRDWLVTEINQELHGNKSGLLTSQQIQELSHLCSVPNDKSSVLTKLKSLLQNGKWAEDSSMKSNLKDVLMKICVRYLYNEKHRGFALNSVANFHLRNGATLWRVNWLANTTARGMTESCGIMANYRYYLDRTDSNSDKYINQKIIDIDPQVLASA